MRSNSPGSSKARPRPMKSWFITGSCDRASQPTADETTGTDRQPRTPSRPSRDRLDRSLATQRQVRVGGQEGERDAVLARRRQRDVEAPGLFAQERIRKLKEDASAVAGLLIAAAGAAVLEVQQDLQPIADDVVADLSLEMRNEANPAGVMLESGVVESITDRRAAREPSRNALQRRRMSAICVPSSAWRSRHGRVLTGTGSATVIRR
jgi:hypothetical protein